MKLARECLESNSGLSDAVLAALLKPHAKDPEPLLLALGLSLPTPAPGQSIVAMMTRPTKPDPQNPIGKARPNPIGKAGKAASKVMLPYPCVGKGFDEQASGSSQQHEWGMTEPSSGSTRLLTTAAGGETTSAADMRAADDERVAHDCTDHADEPPERYTRERDNDHLADTWDTESGGFKVPAHAQTSRRASAEAWVRRELSALKIKAAG